MRFLEGMHGLGTNMTAVAALPGQEIIANSPAMLTVSSGPTLQLPLKGGLGVQAVFGKFGRNHVTNYSQFGVWSLKDRLTMKLESC
mmetsp:Transcript_38239/g.75285  ORF Transcript_38239/g.75285 Transcript_38239/m.75285 type:complete len:86 (+) Transcript_38239:317-574(+)